MILLKHLFIKTFFNYSFLYRRITFALLESMNLGIPCICSNISGIKELIKDNYNGFI